MRHRVAIAILALAATVSFVPAAAPSAADLPPLRIGLIFSFTGSTPWASKVSAATIDAWRALNGDTVAGRKLVIVSRDDTGVAPDVAARMAQELIVQEHVDLLVGTVLTPNAIAVARVSSAAKKPFFVINSATSNVLKDQPYSSRYGFTTQQIIPPIAAYAAKNYGKTAFSVYQDYGPGIDAAKAFAKGFGDGGGTVAGEAAIPLNNKEFSAYIQRVKDAKPAVLFVFLNAQGGGAEFLREVQAAGVMRAGTKVVATGDIVDEYILPTLTDPPIGLVTTMIYSRAHPSAKNKQFVAAFHTASGDQLGPDFAAVAEYDALTAVRTVTEALHGDVSDPDKVMAVVRGMKIDSPRGPLAIDPSTRDAVQNVYLRRLEMVDGKLENVEFATFPLARDPTESY